MRTFNSLGDMMSAPNAKTAAAARKQAPVVAENLLADMGKLNSTDRPSMVDMAADCRTRQDHTR